jgi:hypothetical protein
MKLGTTIFSSFALLAVTAKGNNFKNGKFCDLETSIQCHVRDVNGNVGIKCEDLKRFDLSKCDNGEDHTITAVYTFSYANGNEEGKIKFLTSVNPESTKIPKNDYTFGRANTRSVNVERGDRIQAGETKVFHPVRIIDPCRTSPKLRNRFVAELQMNGHVVGKEGDQSYSCSQRSFYSHRINLFTTAPTPVPPAVSPPEPTVAATLAPTQSPAVAPTPAPTQEPTIHPTTSLVLTKTPSNHGKGKGKTSSNLNRH